MLSHRHFLVVAFVMMAGCARGQSFESFIRKLNQDYSRWSTMHVVMNVSVYDSARTTPYYSQQVSIKRQGDKYWYRFEDNEMLLTENYLIMVDRDTRQITCSKRSLEAERQLASYFKFDIDSILSLYPTPDFLGVENGVQHFRFLQKNGRIYEVHFYIAADGQQLKRMEYHYRGGQLAKIEFKVFESDIPFDRDTFAEGNYLFIDKKSIRPSRYFAQYEVVNLMEQ